MKTITVEELIKDLQDLDAPDAPVMIADSIQDGYCTGILTGDRMRVVLNWENGMNNFTPPLTKPTSIQDLLGLKQG